MFVRPLYNDADPQSWVVDPRNWFNRTDGGELANDPLNYSVSVADGWNGDRLHAYRNADNETGYVWRINWETASDAREFADGYAQLVAHYGGEAVGENTYRITDTAFADAVWVEVDGDTVTIVNAPTVDELTQVRTSATPQTATPTESGEETTETATATPGRTASPTPTSTPATDGASTATRGPGLGAVVAVVALLIAGALARRR
jgi:PGF-CTERM protein